MARTENMQDFIDSFAKLRYGRPQGDAKDQQICIACGRDVKGREDFKNDVSWKEYHISYFCQSCQDKAFGPG